MDTKTKEVIKAAIEQVKQFDLDPNPSQNWNASIKTNALQLLQHALDPLVEPNHPKWGW